MGCTQKMTPEILFSYFRNLLWLKTAEDERRSSMTARRDEPLMALYGDRSLEIFTHVWY